MRSLEIQPRLGLKVGDKVIFEIISRNRMRYKEAEIIETAVTVDPPYVDKDMFKLRVKGTFRDKEFWISRCYIKGRRDADLDRRREEV